MATTILHTSADWRFTITVKDNADAVVDLTAFGNYVAYFYVNPEHVVEKFSRQAKTGYLLLTANDEVNGVFDCVIPKEVTVDFPNGELYVQVKVQLPTSGYVDISIAAKIGQIKNVPIETPLDIE